MTDGPERRGEERAECDIAAKIELSDRLSIACRITNISPSGLQMRIAESAEVPEAFDLLLPVVEGVEQRCRVRIVWREGDRLGGAFLTPLGR